jgi:hypothetical protein
MRVRARAEMVASTETACWDVAGWYGARKRADLEMVASLAAILPAVEEAKKMRCPIKHKSLLTVPIFAVHATQDEGDAGLEERYMGSLVSIDTDDPVDSSTPPHHPPSTVTRRRRGSQHATTVVEVDYDPASTVALSNLKMAAKAMALGMHSVHTAVKLLSEDIPMVRTSSRCYRAQTTIRRTYCC